MIDRTVAVEIVLSALRDAVDQNGGDTSGVTDATVIVGPGAVIDSIGVVSLIVDIEQRLEMDHQVSVTPRERSRDVPAQQSVPDRGGTGRSHPRDGTRSGRIVSSARPVAERQVMLITGTRKGIGRHLAETYASRGYIVEGCSRGEAAFEAEGYTHTSLDITDEKSVKAWISSARAPPRPH